MPSHPPAVSASAAEAGRPNVTVEAGGTRGLPGDVPSLASAATGEVPEYPVVIAEEEATEQPVPVAKEEAPEQPVMVAEGVAPE